eukprot:scaffold68654_cov69-Phaeocystis_antarctica.AAC.1
MAQASRAIDSSPFTLVTVRCSSPLCPSGGKGSLCTTSRIAVQVSASGKWSHAWISSATFSRSSCGRCLKAEDESGSKRMRASRLASSCSVRAKSMASELSCSPATHSETRSAIRCAADIVERATPPPRRSQVCAGGKRNGLCHFTSLHSESNDLTEAPFEHNPGQSSPRALQGRHASNLNLRRAASELVEHIASPT